MEPIKLNVHQTIHDGGKQFYEHNPNLELKGGRSEALKMLANFKRLRDYKEIRDINTESSKKGASKMSAHNKFGCVSIREVY